MTIDHRGQPKTITFTSQITSSPQVDHAELQAATLAAVREFTKPPRRTAALTYLRQRGIDTTDVPLQWPLGYAPPGWTRLVDKLRANFSDDALVHTGLARYSSRGTLIDAFRDRVIFPVHRLDGTVAGFIGRDLSGHESAPKYLNSATSPIYRKSELLYGDCEHALTDGPVRAVQPVIVEGAVDVLAIVARARAEQRSDLLPVAASGTAFTAAHADRTAKLAFAAQTPAVIALDADAAGRTAGLRAGEELRSRGVDTYLAQLPQGSDPAAYLVRRDSTLETFTARHAVPLLTAQVEQAVAAQGDHMQWIEGRLAAARVITAQLATYPVSHAARQIGWIATALDLDASTITFELTNAYRVIADHGLPVGGPSLRNVRIDL